MNKPLSEYPRPQLVRDSYLSLNGIWEYAIRKSEDIPSEFDGNILVPFSPETKMSGVNKLVTPEDTLFYRLKLDLSEMEIKDKLIIHFTAVDQIAELYVNGEFVGKHVGGFLPFEFDIKPFLKKENEIVLKVKDETDTGYHSTGKQKLNAEGIWYPAQSGIYLPVWLESVSNDYIEKLKITPNIDEEYVEITVFSSAKESTIIFENKEYKIFNNHPFKLSVKNPILWSPENPYLYDFKVKTKHDEVSSYFAMRKVSLSKNEKGIMVFNLNNKPYFMKGVLDQGYYEDTLLTPRTDEDYINDIKFIKDLGFNTSRKHIKLETLRWYYYCDKMGLIVWQDFVCGCTKYDFWLNQVPVFIPYKINDHRYKKFFRENKEGRDEARKEFIDTIEYLYNVPSIVIWTIFNEAWGQFDAKGNYNGLKNLDSSRLFDATSGWHDQGVGNFVSKHIYAQKVKTPSKHKLKDRAFICSECGAALLDEKAKNKSKFNIIYTVYNNKKDFESYYERFITNEIIPSKKNGMSAFIYTQNVDVEGEKNGFISYDRKQVKVDVEKIKKINDSI